MPTTPPSTFSELVNIFIGLINILIPTILAIIFLFLVWKIIDAWVINAGDEKKREEGKTLAVIAVIVFVLILTTWGIVAMLRQSLFGI
ncbi:MAG: hypothetical protein H6779_04690 [Candidatus Nomurabacteria bacterium]|nr:hypothetical protein [Candidatus Nomurabacteria bacterium]USN87671.1 MAG: hypothetical protein H6779_04690 [Candidatus Nomurabacteria bacterium]